MSERPQLGVGVILFDEAGRVLLIQRGQEPGRGRWSVPGGRVERGESLAAACLRELQAETGLAATLGPLCEVYEYLDDAYHYVVLDYVARAPRGALAAGEDAADARFVELDELPRLPTTPGLEAVVRKAAALRW